MAFVMGGIDTDAVPFYYLVFRSLRSCGFRRNQIPVFAKTCLSFCYLLMNHIVSNEVCTIRPRCLDRHSLRLADHMEQFAPSAHYKPPAHVQTQVSDQHDRPELCPHHVIFPP